MSNSILPNHTEVYYTEEERMIISMPLSIVLQLVSMRAESKKAFEETACEETDCPTVRA